MLSCQADDEEAAEEARKQAQREQDQQEKEEFEARLRARDDEKTRKLMEARLSKEEMEASRSPCRMLALSIFRHVTCINILACWSSTLP